MKKSFLVCSGYSMLYHINNRNYLLSVGSMTEFLQITKNKVDMTFYFGQKTVDQGSKATLPSVI